MDGLQNMRKLKILYLSNNNVKSFDELSKLNNLPSLEEVYDEKRIVLLCKHYIA